MDTNFQMLRKLDDWTPEKRSIVTLREIKHITNTLCLDEMDEIQLRNMRDFAVMYYDKRMMHPNTDMMKEQDKMSAITSVIDLAYYKLTKEI